MRLKMGKSSLHVRQENGDIDNIVPGRSGVLKHKAHILENGVALLFNLVADDIALRVERHSGNLFAPAHARTDPGKKQQVAHAPGMRKGADRFRSTLAFKGLAH